MSENKIQIRNSTADFLVFVRDSGEKGIEVRVQDGDVWLTQKAISMLFDVERSVVSKHLQNIFSTGELSEISTCAFFAQVADNGKTYKYKFYSLAAIIAVGYRTNSARATEFRQWATKVLDAFAKKGFVLDKNRLENGKIFGDDYFDELVSEIQEIRASERRFYQKITDIYATSSDYSSDSKTTKNFFATVQNKLHYAVHEHTSAELIVEMYLDYAMRQARRHIPMTMEDWAKKLDAFLKFNEADILNDKGKVTAEIAKAFAESEFEKFRVAQDQLYKSDFDKFLELQNSVENAGIKNKPTKNRIEKGKMK